MPLRPSIRRLIVPAFWLGVIVCAFLPAKLSSFATPMHNVVSAAVSPPARLLSLIGSDVRGGTDEQPIINRDLQRLSNEIQSLRNLVLRYQSENAALRLDNQALQELGDTLGRRAFIFRLAQVMSRSPSPSNRALTINLGSRNGVTDGLAVVSGPNLVGRVITAGRVTSDVKLITTQGVKIEAIIMPTAWPNGRPPADRQRQSVLFIADGTEYLTAIAPQDMPVDIGDIAHLRDDDWQADVQGMAIGRVTAVTPERDPVLRKKITIRPMRSLVYLDQVTVIVPREPQ